MRSLMHYTRKFFREEEGPTSVEYAVMLALIIVVAFVAIGTVGTRTSALYNSPAITNALSS